MSEAIDDLTKYICDQCDKAMEALQGATVWCGCGSIMRAVSNAGNTKEIVHG